MNQKSKQLFTIIPIIFIVNICSGRKIIPLTADSLANGSYKDILASFFQVAVNNITGPNKELKFASNPFAVLTKMNPNLLVDTNYYKYRTLRKLNFSFAGKLDSAYHFNGFSSGINYALVNKRDYTVSRAFIVFAFNNNNEYNRLNDSLNAYASKIDIHDPLRAKFREQVNKMLTDSTFNFNQLDTSIQTLVKKFATAINAVHFLKLLKLDPKINVYKASQQTYDSLKNSFQNKLLWTIGISDTTYSNQLLFSNILFSSELSKGIINPEACANLELNIKTSLQLIDDTLNAGRDLKRSIFNFEPGLNLVIKTKSNQQSLVEFKLSGSYSHIFNSLYQNERKDSITINGTLRIRLLNDLWIPLEIKYDPKSGNVFGFLNVKFNFTGLNKLQKSISATQ